MKHLIITRYDYPEDYEHKKERQRLFETYTLPSMKNQTNQNFEWWIIGERKWKELSNYIKGLNDWVVTTRLDNDDVLLPNFTEEISKLKPQEQVIDFSGYRYDERTDKFYEDTKYTGTFTSPFISLMEHSNTYKGVYHDEHQKMSDHFKLKRINKRMWLQIIHETNKLMNQRDIATQGKKIETPAWFDIK